MASLNEFFVALSGMVWGPWMLALLLGTGIYLTVRLRFIQFRMLGYGLKLAFSRERSGEGDIHHFGALMTALASTIGVGNIAGVSTAVALGGPGAVFWMWITALFGMATKYAEALLAVRYRLVNERGEISGGPMFYLRDGLGKKWLGVCFALFGSVAAFGTGNMVQANTVAAALNESMGWSPVTVGLGLAFVSGLVILGGIKRIAEVSSILVPAMVVIYFTATLVILFSYWDRVPEGLVMIFESAFSGSAAAGGFAGATLAQSIRFGVARGMFSNESGMGSAPIAAAAAKTNEPAKQALVSMTGTFLDTIVVCSMTGLVLAATQSWHSGKTGAALTIEAFSQGLPGEWGQWVVTLGVATFAFSTIIGWCYYGEKCLEFLTGIRFIMHYRMVWVLFVFLGAVFKLEIVWNLSDTMNGMMAIPNLIGLLLLGGILSKETIRFERGIGDGSINKFD
ncbi:MAG: sodium:alanine symporter family protein [Candidatus Nitrohelix vancouverensis]|uniref:Sodium:alanine symporter family protein n=1 Tax=Candidatus Nitrohelix vancouverensis TaxID=2705534 RepID=A0A7T0C059_9BACT|nr:MAG: sodium:alanine symporter family protein [Candidatus Nitrohelix vancouverensis]